ncbi:AbiJ-NTD4 domain-containing protein [Albimonas pacifica]|uniref:HEPN AbiJ-N-terminal domain-containing protein n=1 Tax=Albimonas pacifica TaxID=1114924 RepID=A0A1I3EAP1_9RHOB|nr:hypothetical protein [Albimonas pacifica]SFH96014.1 hypothetical protein SAMN05216258_103268 [Albimonas pacifica]
MTKQTDYIPFSQRSGATPIPPQLELGVASPELRRLIDYSFHLELERYTSGRYGGVWFQDHWKRVSQDLHVKHLGRPASTYKNDPVAFRTEIEKICAKGRLEELFDLVEFAARHKDCSTEFKQQIQQAFPEARAAYRLLDGQVAAIGTEQLGEAVIASLDLLDRVGELASRSHLIRAGVLLRNGDWAGSIRESIHSVESVARRLAPDTKTLNPALNKLERQGHLHGGLKAALGMLYGYTSDEEGIRHANIFQTESQVDEADAIFMLGACASFNSYLLYRTQDSDAPAEEGATPDIRSGA